MTRKYVGPPPRQSIGDKELLFWMQQVADGKLRDVYSKRFHTAALSSDPPDPPPGEAVFWLSDGTESGTDGDLMVKRTNVAGRTVTALLWGYVYKELSIEVGDLRAPGTRPATFVLSGITGAWEFSDGTDDTVVFTVNIPRDIDLTTCPCLILYWQSPATTGNVVWQIETLPRKKGEDMTASADQTLSITSPVEGRANHLTQDSFDNFALAEEGDLLYAFRLKRLGTDTNDDCGDVALLEDIALRYRSIQRGEIQ